MAAKTNLILLAPFVIVMGCGSDVGDFTAGGSPDGHNQNPNEVITTLQLTFSPFSGGESVVFTYSAPELNGSATIDDITLHEREHYNVKLEVFNQLEHPVGDVTLEISDEMDEHQVFFTGSVVEGPCNTENPSATLEHHYGDLDNYGLPIGLSNTFSARTSGSGTLNVLLRHLPRVNGAPIKTAELASVMDSVGVTALPGSTDIDVHFNVTVE